MERRLAAILLTDMVGYSRLMGLDEEGTISRQKAHREQVFDPTISRYGGRIIKSTGDGILVEFPSAVDSVKCAVEMQTEMAGRDINEPEDRRIHYRIGINLGDIVIDGDDILGDGVNVAARLESLAKPGGVCVSGSVYDQLAGKLDITFEDAGEQTVKNVPRPVRVWNWRLDQGASESNDHRNPPPLPDKPSIAVLPFVNMSGDAEQEYFSDGISEDIITALSRVGWFFVIARNSSFTFKGQAIKVTEVARGLGVRYILEGSVRKGGDRLRVTAQLIDAVSGSHIWADRYDGQLVDVFDFQDRVSESVVGAIEPKLRQSEIEKAIRKRPDSLDAYDLLLRALPYFANFSKDGYLEARRILDEALSIDPGYAQALAYAAWCRSFSVFFNWSEDVEGDRRDGLQMARAALAADPADATTLRVVGFATAILSRDHETARAHLDQSLQHDPNSALSYGTRGWINIWDENIEEAKSDFDKALRLSPLDSWAGHYYNGLALVYSAQNRCEEGLPWARKAVRAFPGWIATHRGLASTLGHLGELEEAKKVADRILELDPDFTVARFAEASPFKGGPAQKRLFDGLVKAGLPEDS